MAVSEKELEEFGRFAAEQVKKGGAGSLQELASEWEKLRRWNDRNALSVEQSRQCRSGPLDLEKVLERVERRISEQEGST